MQSELIQILTNLGLSDKEAAIYLAATEKEAAPVSSLATAAKINRVTTYDILEKLKKKGLVSHFTKAETKYFTATKPEILLKEFEKRTNDFRTAIPKFKKPKTLTAHPKVRYFEGMKGIKNIYEDTLTSETEILNFSNPEELRKSWPDHEKQYTAKRTEKDIFLKTICPRSKKNETAQKQDKKYYRETKLIDFDQFSFTNEINIYDDKVSIISLKEELIGILIKSTEIANSQRAVFNTCWQFSEIMGENGIKTKMLETLKDKELKNTINTLNQNTKGLSPNLSLF